MKDIEREITDQDVVHVLIASSGQNAQHTDIRHMKCVSHGESYGFHMRGTNMQEPEKKTITVTIDACCDPFLDEIVKACYQRSLKNE
jgi:hypothetical protein